MSQVNMRKVAGLADTIQLGKGGQKVRSSGSVLEARNAADSAYAVFRVADGVADNDAVNLGQVNNLLDGLKWMDPVTVVNTIGNITLSGEQTIDGVLTSSDRVLLTQQTVPSQNGVWVLVAAPAHVSESVGDLDGAHPVPPAQLVLGPAACVGGVLGAAVSNP